MTENRKERWQDLAEQASTEQDGAKLTELTNEITRLLDEKNERHRHPRTSAKD
jgi:hypothetical protein